MNQVAGVLIVTRDPVSATEFLSATPTLQPTTTMPNKRRKDDASSDDEEGGDGSSPSASPQPKRARNDDDEERERSRLEDEEFDKQHEAAMREAIQNKLKVKGGIAHIGIINKIQVLNFLCHKNLTVEFGPQVNFIIGAFSRLLGL